MSEHTTPRTPTRSDQADDRRLGNEQAHLEEERRVRAATTADDPDRIRDEIRMTRGRMDDTLSSLEYRVAPSQVAARSRARLQSRWTRLRQSVMGSSPASRGPGDMASDVGDSARQAPQAVAEKTRGNPMAAGMVAFGLGAIIAGALPESEREQHLAEDAADHLDLQRVRDEVEEVVDDVREPVEARATEGMEEVKKTAQSESSHLQDEARTSQERVGGEARDASRQVRDQSGTA